MFVNHAKLCSSSAGCKWQLLFTHQLPRQDASCAYLRASKLYLHVICHLWTTKPTLRLTSAISSFLYTILLKIILPNIPQIYRSCSHMLTHFPCAWALVWCIDRPEVIYMLSQSLAVPARLGVPCEPFVKEWSSFFLFYNSAMWWLGAECSQGDGGENGGRGCLPRKPPLRAQSWRGSRRLRNWPSLRYGGDKWFEFSLGCRARSYLKMIIKSSWFLQISQIFGDPQ